MEEGQLTIIGAPRERSLFSDQTKINYAGRDKAASILYTRPSTRKIIDSTSRNLSAVESKRTLTFEPNSISAGQ